MSTPSPAERVRAEVKRLRNSHSVRPGQQAERFVVALDAIEDLAETLDGLLDGNLFSDQAATVLTALTRAADRLEEK